MSTIGHDNWNATDRPTPCPTTRPSRASAFGPALNEQGYYVGRVERNLYWVTDGVYQAAFLTTSDGVVLFDAPPTHRPQPPAGDRRDRRRQRREQQGDAT